MAKVYTRTGDKGKTSLYTGERVSKGCQRVETYGTIDEVRVWDVAKTGKQVRESYDRPIASPATAKNLLAYLKMNTITEGGVKKLEDCAHGNHAIFINNNHRAATVESNATIKHHDNLAAAIGGSDKALMGEGTRFAVEGGVDAGAFEWTATNATPATSKASEPTFTFTKAGEQTVTLKLTSLDGVSTTVTKTVRKRTGCYGRL